ncbi:MAG: hypothetical protein ACYTFZ_02300 [Planctomycetota bacterium]|jgi:hypothetical protein
MNAPCQRLLAALCMCLIGLPACAGRVEQRQLHDDALDRKVLIASRDTDFKNAVLTKVLDAFGEEHVFVQVVDVSDLAAQDTKRFDVVVILDRVWAWSLSGPTKEFLAKEADQDRVVLLATSADPDWVCGDPAVDAVTAASRKADVDAVAQDLIVRIRSRLHPY